jgi:predicted DNA-binding protein YlxM (UPF0122 family)|tara:strand:- start:578 stop:1258 length:681 start_codon:yes stop_codon:yes gene_type:complete
MQGAERVKKRSCQFCMSDNRDELEEQLLQGHITPKEIDKNMGWRANTADRHFRNHMGDYHMAANPSCPVCASPKRGDYEFEYFNNGSSTDAIAKELGIKESVVYNHMKHHFQPLVQKTAALEVALTAGKEIELLRSNAQKLNHKLSELLDEGTVHEDGFVRDAVILHKEVRETIKDLLRFEDQWGPQSDGTQINQTINVLQLELSKESPEVWMRVKNQLMANMGVE